MKRTYLPLAASAILLWGSLALLSTRVSHLPPLLMAGISLSIGGLLGVFQLKRWRVPLPTFIVGVAGICGYHILLFTAFQHAPTLEANLLNYLWPLLIVLLSPVFLKGYHLRPRHFAAALAGLLGAGLIVTGGKLQPDLSHLGGYLLAAAAAFVWAAYSLLTKRLPPFSSAAVGGFCLASGAICLTVYALQSGPGAFSAVRPADWLPLLLLGAGPLGAAFFLWDAALKKGDPRVIGSLSYLTPLISTLGLVAVAGKPFTPLSAAAMVLIIAGAVIGIS
jgi:drug/metabolite transporter (DMT)-like permease